MLSVDRVTKCYGDFTALEDISLDFTQGVYGLLAPNGAGKSTLMKMLATLLFPTKGKILWDGEDIVSMGEDYRGFLGYLPQDFGYYPNYTPRQFMRYAAALQKLARAEADQRISHLLELVGLSDAADKKLKKLSGGMLQRVGIAVAMLNEPKLLILDEPTAGLDPGERVRFRNLIHALANDRIVILSTHIVSDIETIAGQIIMLRDHRLLCCDTPSQICSRFRGKVFQIPADVQLRPLQQVLSEGQGENGTVLRILSEMPPADGVAVAPTLEDAFLAIYASGEREHFQ
ncbi:MAG: ABC transporter ATP-binding protein [Lachnospiraceae bacterium]|nr:ABC transporter ATP-binding protein [Lachnospiraceae bacterium]